MPAKFNIPQVRRRQRKEAIKEVSFVPVKRAFKSQRQIRMLKDASGWVNNDKRTGKKWHLRVGEIQYLDDSTADAFIIKGYAIGELSREYSDDERSQILSSVTTLGIGGVNHG